VGPRVGQDTTVAKVATSTHDIHQDNFCAHSPLTNSLNPYVLPSQDWLLNVLVTV